MKKPHILLLPVFLIILASPGQAMAALGQPSTQPAQPQGYVGATLAEIADGSTVFSWFFPGPLDGSGLRSRRFDLQRPDLLVSVDGQAMNSSEFRQYIAGLAPGTEVKLQYRRSLARGPTMPTEVNHEEEIRTITLTIDSAEKWRGTVGLPRRSEVEVAFDGPALLNPDDPDNVLGAVVAGHELAAPLQTLRGVFHEFRDRTTDRHMLSRVRAAFSEPFRLPELQQLMTAPALQAPADPFAAAARLIRENLDADITAPKPAGSARPEPDQASSSEAERMLLEALEGAAAHAAMAMPAVEDEEAFLKACFGLLRVPRTSFYIAGPDATDHLAIIRASEAFEPEHLARAVEAMAPLANLTLEHTAGLEERDPPAALEDAVEGHILSATHTEHGWIVIGGAARNRYDMARLAAVLDVGGHDEYHASSVRTGVRIVIDLAGNDRYSGTADQGAGGAILGVALIDDHGGNDRYEGGLLSCGAAMYGASVLLDRGGNDTYSGTEWSMGAGMYGAGLLIDLGGGGDLYIGEFLCQGVGGPVGLGAIIDDGGRDLFRANSGRASSYGTPAVFSSYSQGMGFGYRNYAAGGIGLLVSLGGDDRYEAGEFAQGGAYYYALGVLHDVAGRDLYYGNRYGQGFGVHQAFGVLADDAGNDTYWSMTAASQGAAWDVGAGLLIDRGGDDSYQADGLAQGGASMQGIALLVDLAGRDRYEAGGGATQGQSGGNDYHFLRTGARSFSLLLDLGGADDRYSTGRENDTVTITGRGDADAPAGAPLHGVVIDR